MNQLALVLLILTACGGVAVQHSNLTEQEAADARGACSFSAGAKPAESIARDVRLGAEIPINTFVLLMMENRSFDHLFSKLPAYGQPDVDVAGDDVALPDGKGGLVPFHHLDDLCFDDTNHDWGGSHVEYDDGKNDGFVIANAGLPFGSPHDPIGQRAMGYYDDRDLPYLYFLASQFAIGDRYFCSLLGSTIPNRDFFYAGTSFGLTYTKITSDPTIDMMTLLETNKVNWHVYSEANPGPFTLAGTAVQYFGDRFSKLGDFFDVAKAGKLEQVVYVDPDLTGDKRDDLHPPGDVQVGEQFVANVVEALIASPNWAHTALFIVFDEHGGLYDHVPPPAACPPDDIAPTFGDMDEDPDWSKFQNEKFDRLGFRVPLIVISPYAKRHFVSHSTYDHTSVLRLIEARFNLPALTRRDANANPIVDLFDFAHPTLAVPARPAQTIDSDKLKFCTDRYPAGTP